MAFGARTLRKIETSDSSISGIVNMVTEQLRRDSETGGVRTVNPHLERVGTGRPISTSEFAGAGLLEDRHEGEGFEVRCDEETNLAVDKTDGLVQVQVAMRPTERLKPCSGTKIAITEWRGCNGGLKGRGRSKAAQPR